MGLGFDTSRTPQGQKRSPKLIFNVCIFVLFLFTCWVYLGGYGSVAPWRGHEEPAWQTERTATRQNRAKRRTSGLSHTLYAQHLHACPRRTVNQGGKDYWRSRRRHRPSGEAKRIIRRTQPTSATPACWPTPPGRSIRPSMEN